MLGICSPSTLALPIVALALRAADPVALRLLAGALLPPWLRTIPPAWQRQPLSTVGPPSPTAPLADVETVVVGAGVIGLAVARQLAVAGQEVVLLEEAGGTGGGVSSRSSEVIHAGLYYPAGSLKARLCVAGKAALYAFCAAHDVPHARLGKLLVAPREQQLPALRMLQAQAAANGVGDLRWLSGAEAAELEPEVQCAAALLSPSTGIVDSHGLMAELHRQFEALGGTTAMYSRLVGGAVGAASGGGPRAAARPLQQLEVEDAASGGRTTLTCHQLVLAAGLGAQAAARSLTGLPPSSVLPLWLAKGSYFSLAPPPPPPPGGTTLDAQPPAPSRPRFSHLVYPLPEPSLGGLGVHLTLDLAGQARFGPDLEWLPPRTDPAALDYRVDPQRAQRFYPAIRAYWPALPDGALQPDYAGVRPKVAGPGDPPADFMIQGPHQHGVPGLVCLYGMESPGLTASLAVAEHVAALLQGGASIHAP